MITRREVLKTCVAVGVAGFFGQGRAAFAAVPQPRAKVSFDVPAGACDCHVHVFGDPKQYPFFAGRSYTPEMATVEDLRQLSRRGLYGLNSQSIAGQVKEIAIRMSLGQQPASLQKSVLARSAILTGAGISSSR